MTFLCRGSERRIDLCAIRTAFLFQLLTQHLARLDAVVVLCLDNENGRANSAHCLLQPLRQYRIPALRRWRERKKGSNPKPPFCGQDRVNAAK